MSLIDDALKRAQAEQSDPTRRTGYTPLPLPDAGRRARRGWLRAAILLLVPAIAVAVVLIVVRARSGDAPRVSQGGPPAAAPPAVQGVAPAPTPEPRTPRAEAGLPREIFVPPPPAPETREEILIFSTPAPSAGRSAREVVLPRESGDAGPAVSMTRLEPPVASMNASGSPMIVRSEEKRPAPPASRSRSFVREGTLPSGERITLDGIVYSDESPAAVVNGRVVSVGSFIQGFEVVRIRADRVELTDGASTIVLLLR